MPVIRLTKPVLTTTTDTVAKEVFRRVIPKPTTAPVYPVTIYDGIGAGRYEIKVVGDGDSAATINVYVDGATTPTDSLASNVAGVISGVYTSSVKITIEGSGLHSTVDVYVTKDTTVVTSVAAQ